LQTRRCDARHRARKPGAASVACACGGRTRDHSLGDAYRSLPIEHRTHPVSGQAVEEPLAILSDRRRPLVPYAKAFREMLAQYCRAVFPITRPNSERPAQLDGNNRSARAAPKRNASRATPAARR
jgi:hypothetical protein